MTTDVLKRLQNVSGATAPETRRDGLWITSPDVDVAQLALVMRELEGRLSTMTAIGRKDGEIDVIYHYVVGGVAVNVKTRTKEKAIASIAPVTKAADWIEREIFDLFGVNFEGHPNLERLLRPHRLPQGFFLKE
jgi:NADH-quinone oxidoreductase subunit C